MLAFSLKKVSDVKLINVYINDKFQQCFPDQGVSDPSRIHTYLKGDIGKKYQ
jgi:hypothetical protein